MYIEITNNVEFTLSCFDELNEQETAEFFDVLTKKYTPEALSMWAKQLTAQDITPAAGPDSVTETAQDSKPTQQAPADNAHE